MNPIRLVAMDLDGTLLRSDHSIGEATKAALQKAADNGVAIVVFTGRMGVHVPPNVKALPFIRYVGSSNGVCVTDTKTGEVLHLDPLDRAVAAEVCDILIDEFRAATCLHETPNRFACDNMAMENKVTQDFLRLFLKDESVHVLGDVREDITGCDLPLEKIVCYFDDDETFLGARRALEARGDVELTTSFDRTLEVTTPGADKGAGLAALCRALGIPLEQAMAVGDTENDVSMVKAAGAGVAMGNATDVLKEAADYVTLSNEEDGIAAALVHYGVI